MAKREAIAFLIIAILSVMSLANSVVDEESCDIDSDGCVDREIKELNEIIKTMASRSNHDTNGYEMKLIKNLKFIKNELQTNRWIENESLDDMEQNNELMMSTVMLATGVLVKDMLEKNDCYVATKVSRTLLKLVGKLFQAHCDNDNMKHRDRNENGCDWYADRQNFPECGEHDVPPNFIANEMCCTCKEIQELDLDLSDFFAQVMVDCYFLQEKNEDGNALIHGVLDILDEFAEAFGKNADKNINIISRKIELLKVSGDNASEYQHSLDFYDLALNMHSRFLGDDKSYYAVILLCKAMKIYNNPPWKSEELDELFNKCLEIFSDAEENDDEGKKEGLHRIHNYFAHYRVDDKTYSIDDKLMHGRKAIKLEREIHGGIRRNGERGYENFKLLDFLGANICRRTVDTSQILKKRDYDEATGYLLEALAIADSHPDVPPSTVGEIYFSLSFCEYAKEGKRNLRKALDYVVRSLLISSKIDKTDNLFSDQLKEKTDLYEKLSKQINQENMI